MPASGRSGEYLLDQSITESDPYPTSVEQIASMEPLGSMEKF
jgi:hypothetical protein